MAVQIEPTKYMVLEECCLTRENTSNNMLRRSTIIPGKIYASQPDSHNRKINLKWHSKYHESVVFNQALMISRLSLQPTPTVTATLRINTKIYQHLFTGIVLHDFPVVLWIPRELNFSRTSHHHNCI